MLFLEAIIYKTSQFSRFLSHHFTAGSVGHLTRLACFPKTSSSSFFSFYPPILPSLDSVRF